MRKIIIAAVAKNFVIGRSSGEMPWHSSEEFKHFKSTTFGSPIIMGRKTFESLEKTPLKGRLNIVLTKSHVDDYPEEVKICSSAAEAYELCEKQNAEKCFVIGGGTIYQQEIHNVDEMILSWMDFEAKGDILFPVIDEEEWKVESREKRDGFEIVHYIKNRN